MTGWGSAPEAGWRASARRVLVAAGAAGLTAVLVAACSGGSDPDGGAAPSTPTLTSSSAPAPSVASSPVSTAERETADRTAVEATWARFWDVHQSLLDKPSAEWPAAVDAVAVDPTRQEALDEAATFSKSGWAFYGQVVNHPYWGQPIDGKDVAVMGDCMDSSKAGTLVVKTGVKRTVGVANNNTRATFVKGTDGAWRVQTIEYLVDESC